MYRCISSAKIHSRFGPSGRSMMLSKIVRNAPCGCGWQLDIFSSATHEHDVGHAGGDRVPALDRHEHAGAAADVRADVGLAPRAGPVREVVPLAVDAVERVGRGARQTASTSVELRCSPRSAAPRVAAIQLSSLPVSCARRTNFVMPAPDDRDPSCHAQALPRVRTATAALLLGTPRQDCATAVGPRPRAVARCRRGRARGRSPRAGTPRRARRPTGSRGRDRGPRGRARRGAGAACTRRCRRPRRCRCPPALTPARAYAARPRARRRPPGPSRGSRATARPGSSRRRWTNTGSAPARSSAASTITTHPSTLSAA